MVSNTNINRFPSKNAGDGERLPSTRAFGHRLTNDQSPMEYLIEFLMVVSGKKLTDKGSVDEYFLLYDEIFSTGFSYEVERQLGLKRFIFLSRSKKDGQLKSDLDAYQTLRDVLEQHIEINRTSVTAGDILSILELLLYRYHAVVGNRGWHAQMILPLSPTFILPEAFPRSRAQAADPDDIFDFHKHNFLARGGEVYYLHLILGLRGDDEARERLTKLIEALFMPFASLDRLGRYISNMWDQTNGEKEPVSYSVGWIRQDADGFGRRARLAVSELASVLACEFEPVSKFEVLSTVIVLDLMRSLHEHACYLAGEDFPLWAIRLTNSNEMAIRKWSEGSFNNAQQDFTESLRKVGGDPSQSKDFQESLERTSKLFKKLMKAIGLVRPVTGPGAHFTLNEHLVKTLVTMLIPPGQRMLLTEFTNRIKNQFGMVFWPDDAMQSSFFRRNREAWINLLDQCGYLTRLSDATEIVFNPYGGINV